MTRTTHRRARRGRTLVATTGALALGVTVLSAAPGIAAPGKSAADEVPVRVWVTTPDRAELLHERAPVHFTEGGSDLTTIRVDPRQRFQSMDGFGASITDSSAAVLSGLDPATREATMRSLFDPRDGIGVSFLRQPVGSSDFTADDHHWTYDDVPAGETDFPLEHFSIAHDEKQVLPLLREAKRLNPEITVLATPWSPPAWMKTGHSLVGGRLKDDPKVYDAYARYLVKFVQAYAAAGVPVDYLTVQNEPQNRTPDGYPGTDLPVRQEVKVIEALGPLLRAASPHTRILAYDHNWATHPDDVANTPPGESPETDYPYEVLASPAATWVAGTAYHCYAGDPGAQTALHDAYPKKGIWFTECSGSHGPDDTVPQIFRGTLTWHARTLTVGTTRNWAKSVVNWNIALREDGGPHLGGCDTCTGLVTVMPDGTVRTDAEYYTIGHLSKFVAPGAVRIGSTSYGNPAWNGQVTDVAFRNPDGSTALVVHNENDDPRSFAVRLGAQRFEYTLPGGSVATFVWGPDGALDRSVPTEVSTDGADATATSNAQDAGLVVDGDGSTRWSSGTGQTPGQSVTIDLRRVRTFDTVDVDSGGNLGDYARGYRVETSKDGAHWTTFGEGTGTGQLETVTSRTTAARWVRVTSTASAGNWWSISQIRLYRSGGPTG
ncbi:glycoside hydrolase family 30 beta sandwich domain-containing protein [Phycicoccus flavus]|uniref:glycoside hydrolase family 30 beta sandwich domain-containing protein n=1 Tax=Phycicoccus flavus TaxID=2502783 RepID=UPI000FEB876E|nr:glycoside hydrolase family 30 beta sandwich domain-containing protein [Phycicoccus flavus]NHA67839.1 glucan endo-1,6-beta-glucosidase [Phycicoccus flavus]